MAFYPIENAIGIPPIASVSDASSPAVTPGKIVRAKDPVYGEGEFIYLPVLSGQTVGQMVTYNSASGVTPGSGNTVSVALTTSTKNQARPFAVAMAANTSGTTKYGWFCIQGTVPIKKVAIKVSPTVALFLGATSGRVTSTAASGKGILGIRSMNSATVASATSTVLVEINRPHLQGQTI